jgi:serine/threonine-protein kinase ULK/ATG1
MPHRSLLSFVIAQRAEKNIYLIIEYCSGGDLTNYIKKRGRVEGLQYAPYEGAKLQYYEHPRTGGLDEVVVRCFLRQLGKSGRWNMGNPCLFICFSQGTQVLTTEESDP